MTTKKLLLVEDDRRMRSLLSYYFRCEGFEIMEAANGQQALDIFRASRIDLVILDIMLPIIDGWQVCSAIRKKISGYTYHFTNRPRSGRRQAFRF